MSLARRAAAPVFVFVLLGAAAGAAPRPPGTPFAYGAPAGERQTGPLDASDPYTQILPSGRIVRPTGKSVVVGMNALGFALSPDGRYAIVSNDDEKQGGVTSMLDGKSTGGYSLAVVDTNSMSVVDRYVATDEMFFAGIVALRDPADANNMLVLAAGGGRNAVYAFDLDASGHLKPDAQHAIAIPGPSDPHFGNNGLAFPSTLVLSPDHARVYAVDELGNAVVTVDTKSRTLAAGPVDVGFFPFGAALTERGLLVANEGLTSYGVLSAPAPAPTFASVPENLERASSLSLVGLASNGDAARLSDSLAMDRAPDGLHAVGGAHPVAVAAMRRRGYAFVALSGVDRIATVSLGGLHPKVVGGTELRLFERGPYGTQPSALALAEGQRRLYVALAGIDAIAVLDVSDPVHPHRLGLIPTGWYPTALLLSADGKHLYVTNAKGFGHDPNFHGDGVEDRAADGRILKIEHDSNVVWATFERIDLTGLDLRRSTTAALAYLRVVKPAAKDPVVPQSFETSGSAIQHVVFIIEENKTYDAMLGDLTDASGNAYGPGDASLVAWDHSVTPNLHALASTFGVAGNLYADSEESDAGHQFATGGIASLYTERTLYVKKGRHPMVNKNEDPEDYPRAGYIFNSLAVAGKSFRDYGELIRLSGYDEGEAKSTKADDPAFAGVDDQRAATRGLGGLYSLDRPAPLALADHVDMNYPGWNLRIRDVRRAAEFVRDFDPLVKADRMPDFTYVYLPDDHGGHGAHIPPLPEEVADGDRALGRIVDYLSHAPQWSSTAIFITPDDAQSGRDHVNEHRTYAIVVSPYAKRHYLGMQHLSTVSLLKTEEEMLGLPALALGDALASDLADFFTATPDATPYSYIDVPKQTASVEGARIAALLGETDQSGPDADPRGSRLIDLSRQADRLAATRGAMSPQAYASAQAALYRRALAVVQ